MQELYSRKDLQAVTAQLKKRWLLLGCAAALCLAVFVVSMIIRQEWLSVGSLFLLAAMAIFVIDQCILPLHRYRKLLLSALTGRTHTETLEFRELESETSLVDGVPCRGMIFLGAPDKHGTREQRFYWDEELPLPTFSSGSQITLKYTGRNIIGYQPL